ncbi:VanZ family protein [Embleya scabrispora]|uniref:VanZ family protein n=1 Tax=Embleya scabrispora TaxID=159449 RepID=UPI000364244F|nr:VanZ family protein [Embleya scabrispora]MYS87687.1 VanZ family protein [Streptomyces sp. SID5474]
MGGVWSRWGAVLLACAIAAPLVLLLALRRPRVAVVAGMVLGTLPWVWMVLTPVGSGHALSLLPLRDLAAVLRGDPVTAVIQVGGNLAVFAALGFLLPFHAPRFAGRSGARRIAGLAASASAAIEIAQWLLAIGRVSSVDDVLLNASGAVLAAGLCAVCRAAVRATHPRAG